MSRASPGKQKEGISAAPDSGSTAGPGTKEAWPPVRRHREDLGHDVMLTGVKGPHWP